MQLVALLAARDCSKLAIIGVKERVANDRPFFRERKRSTGLLSRAGHVAGYDNEIGGNGR